MKNCLVTYKNVKSSSSSNQGHGFSSVFIFDTPEVTEIVLPKVTQNFILFLLAEKIEPNRFFHFFPSVTNMVKMAPARIFSLRQPHLNVYVGNVSKLKQRVPLFGPSFLDVSYKCGRDLKVLSPFNFSQDCEIFCNDAL